MNSDLFEPIPDDWNYEIFSEVININPNRKIKKDFQVKFVSMPKVKEFYKKISSYEVKKFAGGRYFSCG